MVARRGAGRSRSTAGHSTDDLGYVDPTEFCASQIGRVERSLFMLDWIESPELRMECQAGRYHLYADSSRGLDMALRVHGLAVHAEDGYGEWGVSGSLRLVPGGLGRGLTASLTPSYGVDPDGSERLWALPESSGLAAKGEAAPSSRIDAEVGYELPVFGGGFTGTPNVGFGLSEAARDLRLGWRLSPAGAGGFELNLDAGRRESADDRDAEHGVMLRSTLRR